MNSNTKALGFLCKNGDKYYINRKKTKSILINQLHVDLLLYFKQYFNGKLLDAGCGEAPYRLIYEQLVDEYVTCDYKDCIHDQSNIDVFASIDNLPFQEESFDTVLCTNVLEHVAESGSAFSEISRVLKNNGYAIISVPFLIPIHEAPRDFYRYTIYGLKYQLKKNGLNIEKMCSLGGVGMLFMVYFNYAVNIVLKNTILTELNCVLQNVTYPIYKFLVFRSITKEPRGISSKLTTHFL